MLYDGRSWARIGINNASGRVQLDRAGKQGNGCPYHLKVEVWGGGKTTSKATLHLDKGKGQRNRQRHGPTPTKK
jgi:hypothetical protein